VGKTANGSTWDLTLLLTQRASKSGQLSEHRSELLMLYSLENVKMNVTAET